MGPRQQEGAAQAKFRDEEGGRKKRTGVEAGEVHEVSKKVGKDRLLGESKEHSTQTKCVCEDLNPKESLSKTL